MIARRGPFRPTGCVEESKETVAGEGVDASHGGDNMPVEANTMGDNPSPVNVDTTGEERLTDGELKALADLRQAQAEDPAVSQVMCWLKRSPAVPALQDMYAVQPESLRFEIQQLVVEWDYLMVVNGLLVHLWDPGTSVPVPRWVVPKTLRWEFLTAAHEGQNGSHLNVDATRRQLRRMAYWVSWGVAVEDFVQDCTVCHPPYTPIVNSIKISNPWAGSIFRRSRDVAKTR